MKAIPAPIAEALRTVDPSTLPGRLVAPELDCEGAAFHSPSPLLLHETVIEGRPVLLCGTCLANLSVLKALRGAHRELSWPVLRSFGNRLRALLIPKESDV